MSRQSACKSVDEAATHSRLALRFASEYLKAGLGIHEAGRRCDLDRVQALALYESREVQVFIHAWELQFAEAYVKQNWNLLGACQAVGIPCGVGQSFLLRQTVQDRVAGLVAAGDLSLDANDLRAMILAAIATARETSKTIAWEYRLPRVPARLGVQIRRNQLAAVRLLREIGLFAVKDVRLKPRLLKTGGRRRAALGMLLPTKAEIDAAEFVMEGAP